MEGSLEAGMETSEKANLGGRQEAGLEAGVDTNLEAR